MKEAFVQTRHGFFCLDFEQEKKFLYPKEMCNSIKQVSRASQFTNYAINE